ncbi:MAG: VOC family protein [Solirubrobacteraceae bacterium]
MSELPGVAEKPSVFRDGSVSYLHIPAPDPPRSASFYAAAFGWSTSADATRGRFTDISGHVIGHFVVDLPVTGEAGVRPYVYVDGLDETLARIVAEGCEVLTGPYAEGDLWVATFRDPAGNVIGAWQRGPLL